MPRIDNELFYKNALKKYGATAKGLNWHNRTYQLKRFEVILELIKDDIQDNDLIIDAGCGFGDLYPFISAHHKINYIGYEIIPKSVKIAKERTKQPIVIKDILHDRLDSAEFYIASGSMNILSRFETYLFIERCFERSKKGFVFNLPYGKDESQNFNYFLPKDIIDFTKKFECKVEIKEGYLPNDFTVYLKKISSPF